MKAKDLIPEWKAMRDGLQQQIEFFAPNGPGLNPAYPVDKLLNWIEELDALITYYSSPVRI